MSRDMGVMQKEHEALLVDFELEQNPDNIDPLADKIEALEAEMVASVDWIPGGTYVNWLDKTKER